MIGDHLVDHVVKYYGPLNFDLPNKDVVIIEDDDKMNDWWAIYFDAQ